MKEQLDPRTVPDLRRGHRHRQRSRQNSLPDVPDTAAADPIADVVPDVGEAAPPDATEIDASPSAPAPGAEAPSTEPSVDEADSIPLSSALDPDEWSLDPVVPPLPGHQDEPMAAPAADRENNERVPALVDRRQRMPAGGRARPAVPALGEILIERKLLTADQLRQAMERQQRTRRRLGRILVDMGFTTADAVLDALGMQLGVPSTRLNAYTINPEAVKHLPEKVARKHMAFPLLKVGSTLVVAIPSPKNLHALDDLRFASGCGIQTMVAFETEIQAALDKYYGNRFGPAEQQEETGIVVIDVPGPQLDLHDEAAERSAVSLVDRVIARAATDRASDIHLEPTKNSLRVRFRIDGTFHEIAHLLLAVSPAVLARVKVLSGMDITEHRVPQDGRFSATVGGRGLDVRSSTYPTIWGEKAVLRLLDRTRLQLSLDTLMSAGVLETFRELIRRPEGIILVTGPTGSGKTSSLYAALAELAELGKNIVTIEDPVEYWLPGVNQGQTNHKAGFDFARGLRAMLRQDPDVIMVGEIRDSETVETAIEAALTGHLVLSTLHTNSAVATVTRLLEMGLEPYLLASAVTGILAQRLVRRICETCKEPMPTPTTMRALFGSNPPSQIYRGIGCQECRGTGFHGRLGIYELLVMNDELRLLMNQRVSEAELQEAARRAGSLSLRDACLERVKDGSTTLEEVIRVTMARSDQNEEEEDAGDGAPGPTARPTKPPGRH